MSTPATKEHFTTDGFAESAYHLNRYRRTFQFFLFAVAVDVLLILVELAAGISPLDDIRRNPWLYGYVSFITLASFSFFGAMIGWREDQLEALALRDSLTGLFNSRYLWARMDEQWATGKREPGASSLVLFDLDYFKRVNDSYGHPVGDELLKHIGRILQNAARKGDTVSRIGGEEFVLFLPNTSETEASAIAERIRQTVSRTALATRRKQPIKITVSAGVAGTNKYTTITPQALYALADKALYLAKAQGRNRVTTCNVAHTEIGSTLQTSA